MIIRNISLAVCTGLPTEWNNKLETTTQFPVNPGTVVKVTCSDPGEVTGIFYMYQVTCSSGTIFTYKTEPRCKGIKILSTFNSLATLTSKFS